ncbi:MAG TPA: hypothetical protein DCM68_01175 [Verrucomicrobia bacterium]|nr:hypothetical protein [Verrucomicrobiota bacterium]
MRRAGGEAADVIAPVILSASRATDIPAFYADWFMNRMRAGFFRWRNPFNPAQVQTVSTANVRVLVFWSKHPAGLWPHLDELDRRGFHTYFQYTLNDYEAEGVEPNLPPLRDRIGLFLRLSERLGPERVVWRMDPLLLTDGLGVPEWLERAEQLSARLAKHARKLVFSFADIEAYPAVKRHLARVGTVVREFTRGEMEEFARGLAEINRAHGLELATCAEEVDLSAFGIAHNRCVDGERLARLWPEDGALMEFLGSRAARKDQGQRKACGCIASKDIGRYRTCPHACAYCYANGSRAEADRNFRAHRPEAESL